MDIKLDQLTITPKAEGPALADPPLIDFCNTPEASVTQASESRPLIDLLVNTPDVDRNAASKPPHEVGQVRHGRRVCAALASGHLSSGFAPLLTYFSDPGEWPVRLLRVT